MPGSQRGNSAIIDLRPRHSPGVTETELNELSGQIEREPGPSWARSGWPLAELDELNLGLDPTQASIEAVRKASSDQAAAKGADPDAIRRAADDSIRAMMLIRTYRVRGH